MNHKFMICVLAVTWAFPLGACPVFGELAAFLRLDGIVGDTADTGLHYRWSDLLSYDISVQNSGRQHLGSGSQSPTFSDMYVTKAIDGASPYFFGGAVSGMPFGEAKIHLVQASEPDQSYVEWILRDLVISAYNTVYDGGQSAELVAFDFGIIEYRYYPRRPDGSVDAPTGFLYEKETGHFEWIGTAPATGFLMMPQFAASSTPEPSTALLAGIGISALLYSRRRGRAPVTGQR